MRPQPSEETIAFFAALAKKLGAKSFVISTSIVCDHCLDAEKEAFPYYVRDVQGKYWKHLCNDCFELLGCEIRW